MAAIVARRHLDGAARANPVYQITYVLLFLLGLLLLSQGLSHVMRG